MKNLLVLGFAMVSALAACASANHRPLHTVAHVDLQRFMGDWYVIGVIPTYFEKGAHNAVESYARKPDGSIATAFNFRQDGFDGKQKTYHPTGFVAGDGSNAVWGMQFIWPIKAEYLIVHVDPGYTQTVIARNTRDHVWIMARTPTMDEKDYAGLVKQIGEWGYDTSKIERVPQRW
jgi:apolipoprotein D and lipocalin family protein